MELEFAKSVKYCQDCELKLKEQIKKYKVHDAQVLRKSICCSINLLVVALLFAAFMVFQ